VPNLDGTANVGELFTSVYYERLIDRTEAVPVFTAPFPLKVISASLVLWQGALAANNTNYWRLELRRVNGSLFDIIATKDTRLSAGEAMVKRADWNWDAVAWHNDYSEIPKGSSLDVAFNKVGAPPNLNEFVVTLRYEPI
jgi:hypothetical protein